MAHNWQRACFSASMRRLSLHHDLKQDSPARLRLLSLLALPGCAGGGASSGTPPPPPPQISVSVIRETSDVRLGPAHSTAAIGSKNFPQVTVIRSAEPLNGAVDPSQIGNAISSLCRNAMTEAG